MAKLKWALPCLIASVDRFTNAITLTHLIDEIGIPEGIEVKDPAKPQFIQPGFAFVSMWERSDLSKPEKKLDVKLTFVGPEARKVTGLQFSVDLGASARARNVSRFSQFPFVGLGRYTFQLHIREDGKERWKKIAAVDLPVGRAPMSSTETRQ